MAARKPKAEQTEEQKYETKLDNYNKYHKDKNGINRFTKRLVALFNVYERMRRQLPRGSKGTAELKVVFRDRENGDVERTLMIKDSDIVSLRSRLIKEMKSVAKIFTWSKKRRPNPRKLAANLTVADIKGNNSPTVLGEALKKFVEIERLVDPAGNSLLQTLRSRRGGQASYLEQGYALGTAVGNILFLAADANSLQNDPTTRSKVTVDNAFKTAFGSNIPAIYSYTYNAATNKNVKVPNDSKLNTFQILGRKRRKAGSTFDPDSGFIKTQNFQEIRAVNMYSKEDVKAGRIPGGADVANFLNSEDARRILLDEFKVIDAFKSAWSKNESTIRAKEETSRTQQQARARGKSPR